MVNTVIRHTKNVASFLGHAVYADSVFLCIEIVSTCHRIEHFDCGETLLSASWWLDFTALLC